MPKDAPVNIITITSASRLNSKSTPPLITFENVKISLKGMTEGAYVFENLNNGETFEGNKNLEITLPEKHSSVIFEYKLR